MQVRGIFEDDTSNMKISLTKKDVIWSYIGVIMSMTINLIMFPVIVKFLEVEMMGLWYVFTSVGALATLFDFGFSVTFARNITYCWGGARELLKENVVQVEEGHTVNYVLMKKVLYACRIIYFRISIVVFCLLLTIGSIYIYIISKNVLGYQHIIAWFIYSLGIFLNLYYAYYVLFLKGVGAVGISQRNVVISRMSQLLITVVFLYLGFGLIGLCAAYLTYGTLLRILGKREFLRYKGIGKELSKVEGGINREELKSIMGIVWHNAWRDGVISIANYLNNQACTIICSLYLTLYETGVYSLGGQIVMAVAMISNTIYFSSLPQLQAAYVNKDRKKVQDIMSVGITNFILCYGIGILMTVVLCVPLLTYIKPEAVISIHALLGLAFYQLLVQIRNNYTGYYSSTNRIVYLKSFLYSAILCVILSILLVGFFKLGMWGLIVAQILSQLIYNAWYWPARGNKELGLSFMSLFSIGLKNDVIYLRNVLKKNL